MWVDFTLNIVRSSFGNEEIYRSHDTNAIDKQKNIEKLEKLEKSWI